MKATRIILQDFSFLIRFEEETLKTCMLINRVKKIVST